MDAETLTDAVLGDDAPTRRRDLVWSPLTENLLWPLTMRTAVCEIPAHITDDGTVYACCTVATLDGHARHVCAAHWRILWQCATCGAWLPDGVGGYCRSGWCFRADVATQKWLMQQYGAESTGDRQETD